MGKFYQEGHTGFFALNADMLLKVPHMELVEELRRDELFRSSILSGIGNFANDSERYPFFKEWDYKKYMKFDDGDYDTVIHFTIAALQELRRIQNSVSFVENRDRGLSDKEMGAFDALIPERYKGATVESLTDSGEKRVADEILAGKSFAIYAGKNVDLTYIGWAVARELRRNRKDVQFVKFLSLCADISSNARGAGGSIGYIESNFVKALDVFIIDDVESLSGTDASTKNVNYLIRQRYENRLQTVLMLNSAHEGATEKDLKEVLGEANFSLFKDSEWPATIVALLGGKG